MLIESLKIKNLFPYIDQFIKKEELNTYLNTIYNPNIKRHILLLVGYTIYANIFIWLIVNANWKKTISKKNEY